MLVVFRQPFSFLRMFGLMQAFSGKVSFRCTRSRKDVCMQETNPHQIMAESHVLCLFFPGTPACNSVELHSVSEGITVTLATAL